MCRSFPSPGLNFLPLLGSHSLFRRENLLYPISQVWLLEGRGGEELRLAAGLTHGKYRAATAKPSDLSNCYISALHILQADAMDSREYKLRLENEHGAEEHIAQLTVGGLQWRKETVIGSLVRLQLTLEPNLTIHDDHTSGLA